MFFKNVAVVGSNGFIGSHLSNKLVGIPGINVSLFGRSSSSSNPQMYHQLDVSNEQQVKHFFAKTDLVYYLASETIPATSWEDPTIELEKNLLPFLSFLNYISSLSVKKIVFISSAGTIYGSTDLNVTEDSHTQPFSPYGINKLTMEYYLNYFKVKYDIQYDIYRVSNLYGEGQVVKKGVGIINTFLENILSTHKIEIFGTGENVRNYIYIADVVRLITMSLSGLPDISNTFNASSNDTLSINELVKIMRGIVSEDFEVLYTATRQSDNSAIYLDNTKILKYYPEITLTPITEGILKTYTHIKMAKG